MDLGEEGQLEVHQDSPLHTLVATDSPPPSQQLVEVGPAPSTWTPRAHCHAQWYTHLEAGEDVAVAAYRETMAV